MKRRNLKLQQCVDIQRETGWARSGLGWHRLTLSRDWCRQM
jgi:hypothetical protein